VIRRIVVCLAFLISFPALAQTRLYFPVSTASAVNPAFDAGWEENSEATRRKLENVKGSDAITLGDDIDIGPPDDSGDQEIDRQYVSTRMDAGAVFVIGVTTVSMQLMMREFALSDNVDKCIIGIRVVSEDGGTVMATLLGVANYGITAEFAAGAAGRNKTCADGDTLTGSYTSLLGERLVVEIGYQTTGADTSPIAEAKYGQNATDLPVNETQTTDGAGWIEFSNTITFAGEAATAGPRRVVVIE
jgi:hypothetical protein